MISDLKHRLGKQLPYRMDGALQIYRNHAILVVQLVFMYTYIACVVREVVLYLRDNKLRQLAAKLLFKVSNDAGFKPKLTLLRGRESQN